MSTPFEQCAVLEVTMSRGPKDHRDSSFKGAGKLIMMIDGHGFVHHFVLPGGIFMKPEEINQILEMLGEKVRVDDEGKPYDMDEVDNDRHDVQP